MYSKSKNGEIIVVGVNHHQTPVHVRERFSVSTNDNASVVNQIAKLPNVKECVVLSTCNRTEVYAVVTNVVAAVNEIQSFLLTNNELKVTADNRWLKLLRSDALLHLFRVASGLDSLILGETQILSQVKGAYQLAVNAGTIGPILEHAFASAMSCGKRVRSNTEISKRPVSVSSAAVELGRKLLGGALNGRSALVIGAGEMATICVKHLLADRELRELKVVTRSENYETLSACKDKHGARMDLSQSFSSRHDLSASVDFVVVATSSSQYVLTAEELKKNLESNSSKKQICIIDISVPRNVDPEIASIPGVSLYHADDLAEVVTQNKSVRESLLCAADEIVFAALDEFASWERSMVAIPTIKKFRDKIEQIRVERIEKFLPSKLENTTGGAALQDVDIEQVTRQLVNQILHEPTKMLKEAPSSSESREISRALELLFSLNSEVKVK